MGNDFRHWMNVLCEAAMPSFDMDYYMTEGCGIFAYALWLAYGKPINGMIGIIANAGGEPWSRSIPFEVTHAYFDIGGKTIDVRGVRSVEDMVEELYLGEGYDDEGPYPADTFRRRFMGMSDRFPLYGGVKEIKQAVGFIAANRTFYGLPETVTEAQKTVGARLSETAATPDEIARIARQYQDQFEDGHVAAGPASRFRWHLDSQYPMTRIALTRDALDLFQRDRRAWADEGEPDRYDDLLNEPIHQPIIVVEIGGLSYIWDGNHRVAASLLTGRAMIPAYVGRLPPTAF